MFNVECCAIQRSTFNTEHSTFALLRKALLHVTKTWTGRSACPSLPSRPVARLPVLLDVDEEADEVVCMLFFDGQDSLEDAAGSDVVVADVTDHFRVRIDG